MDKHLAVADSFIRDAEQELKSLPTNLHGNAGLLHTAEDRVKRTVLPNLDRALKNLEQAEPGEPKSALVFKAIALQAAAHQYRGDAICSYYTKGWHTDAGKHYEEAVQVLEELVAQFDDRQDVWFLLALARQKVRNKSGTLAALDRVIELDATSEIGIEAEKVKQVVQEQKEGCFIATVCYRGYDHSDVQVFRNWRDDVLLPSTCGRVFVSIYYAVSPDLARRLANHNSLLRIIRCVVLEPLVRLLRHSVTVRLVRTELSKTVGKAGNPRT